VTKSEQELISEAVQARLVAEPSVRSVRTWRLEAPGEIWAVEVLFQSTADLKAYVAIHDFDVVTASSSGRVQESPASAFSDRVGWIVDAVSAVGRDTDSASG
jgi:hypothetical protein